MSSVDLPPFLLYLCLPGFDVCVRTACVYSASPSFREIEIPGVHPGFVERVMKGIYCGDLAYIWVRTFTCMCLLLCITYHFAALSSLLVLLYVGVLRLTCAMLGLW